MAKPMMKGPRDKKKSLKPPFKAVFRQTPKKPEPDDVSVGPGRAKKLSRRGAKRLEKAII